MEWHPRILRPPELLGTNTELVENINHMHATPAVFEAPSGASQDQDRALAPADSFDDAAFSYA